jgi:excisionase family DNA binding protein
MDKKLMSAGELADYLGVTGRTIYNWIKEAKKIGRAHV